MRKEDKAGLISFEMLYWMDVNCTHKSGLSGEGMTGSNRMQQITEPPLSDNGKLKIKLFRGLERSI